MTRYEARLRHILRLSYGSEGLDDEQIDAAQTAQWDVLRSAVGEIVSPATLLTDQVIEAATASGRGRRGAGSGG